MTVAMDMFGRITSSDGHAINYIFKPGAGARSQTICVLLHGLFSDKNENGRYQRLADIFNQIGRDTIRFDFRGHGKSELNSDSFTIGGAINDLSAVLLAVVASGYSNIHLIASSFSSCIALLYHSLPQKVTIRSIALLNPVIDLRASVLMARHDNGQRVFDQANVETIVQQGQLKLPNGFIVSLTFYHEISLLKPYDAIAAITSPIMVLHGTADEKVDHEISILHFSERKNCQLILLENAAHAFKNPDHEARVFRQLQEWITGQDLECRRATLVRPNN